MKKLPCILDKLLWPVSKLIELADEKQVTKTTFFLIPNTTGKWQNRSTSTSSSAESTISTLGMRRIIDDLKGKRHRSTTRHNYYTIWKIFNKFCIPLDVKPNNWEDRVLLFVAYLIDSQKQSQTVRSYISAIRAILQENNIVLNEDIFLLSSLTRACKLTNDKINVRLPIHKGMLCILLQTISKKFLDSNQPYLSLLYKTLFLTVYYGLFRVSELTSSCSNHAVKAKDVQIGFNKKKIMFILQSSKTHGEDAKPQIIKIASEENEKAFKHKKKSNANKAEYSNTLKLPCPYSYLRDYALMHIPFSSDHEQFFIFRDGSPVSANNFQSCLKSSLKLVGFDSELYSLHSLRSGRAEDLLKLGLSIETIKKIGRWKSNAVFKYLKFQ